MGLFSSSSKSKSTSTTTYTDNSTNISADLSSGDLSSGAERNIVAGGSVNVQGITDDLANQIFGAINTAYKTAGEWVSEAIGKSDATYKENVKTLQTSNQDTVKALQTAYNSEQSTISSFKTYALYGLFAFVAWAYFGRRK